ncbi:DUF6266 family protein [Pedobacter sp. MC2016-15]|uniref:DUF6266 family protein n=1 Tax=Pedobacter sp. MC2016-15 TaxID=2994473 RepID=UPI002246CF0B|nr:DUF6266 family protein [Pedobacter sp. MC2016-15]MCX2477992.1 DUF6266 family protein [Pedobacter sp. MC2016-15]
MATILKGFLDNFRGLLGNAVGAKWRTLNVIKGRPSKSSKPATEAQLAQQMKFSLATELVSTFSAQIKVGYQSYSKTTTTPTNAAVKQILSNAIIGIYPDIKIDYPKVQLSKGSLLGVDDIKTVWNEEDVTLTWRKNDFESPSRNDSDKIIMMFYDPLIKQFLLHLGARRGELTTKTTMPYTMRNHPIHAYMFLVSEDGKNVSNSEYIGEFKFTLPFRSAV